MDTSNIWCWLWPILTGIIAGIIGYYWGKSNSKTTSNCDEWIDKNRSLQSSNDKLAADLKANQSKLDACLSAKAQAGADASSSNNISAAASGAAGMASGFAAGSTSTQKSSDSSTTSDVHASTGAATLDFNSDAAKAAMGKKIKTDDLTVVEGIGPKISELFHNHDIKTWHALSTTSLEKCQEVLQSGGKRFEMHHPGSWPLQAGMAYEGKWEELSKWQDEHKGGRL